MSRVATRNVGLPLLLAFLYIAWGSTFLAIASVVSHIPPLTVGALRFIAAAAILLPIVVTRRSWRTVLPTRRQLPYDVLGGVLLFTIGNGCIVSAQSAGVPSWLASLLIATVPVWVALLRVVWGPRPRALVLIGVVLGLGASALLLASPDSLSIGPGALGLGIASAIGWSVGTFITARRGGADDPLVTSFRQIAIGGIGLVIVAAGFERDEWSGITWTPQAAGSLIWLTVVSSVLALIAFYRIVGLASVSVASTYAFANPLVALTLSVIVLNEWPGPRSAIAIPLIVIAVAMIVLGDRSPARRGDVGGGA